MKLLALVSLALLAAPALATGGPVTLQVTYLHHLLPAIKECAVSGSPANGAQVLDAAVADGCIDSWDAGSFPGFGRYVTCVDDLCEQPGTYWVFYVNEAYQVGGIDNTNGAAPVRPGDIVEFTYADWETPCVDVADPCNLVP